MGAGGVVLVQGPDSPTVVRLPAAAVAEAFRRYARERVSADRHRPPGTEPFDSRTWTAAALLVSGGGQIGAVSSTRPELIALTDWCKPYGVSDRTARRWVQRIPGAEQINGRWLVPATARPPTDRRATTT